MTEICIDLQNLTELKVVASFSIIADLARNVGGDKIELSTLVPVDGDGHTYEPSAKDAATLEGADVVLVNGLEFEGFHVAADRDERHQG